MTDFTSSIQARAASLRKTNNLIRDTSVDTMPKLPPKPSVKPKKPKPSGAGTTVSELQVTSSVRSKLLELEKSYGKVNYPTSKQQNETPPEVKRRVSSHAKPFYSNTLPKNMERLQNPEPCDDYEPEEAYDDIETIQQKRLDYLEQQKLKDEPPPLPPPNPGLRRSTSFERMDHKEQQISSMQSTSHRLSQTLSENKGYHTTLNIERSKSTFISSSPNPLILKRSAISEIQNQISSSMPPSVPPPPPPSTDLKINTGPRLTLHSFVDKLQNQFPMQMKIAQEMHGSTAMKQGDVYNIHFLKTTEVVIIATNNGGFYSVPLNSAIQFGAVYNPTKNVQDAMQGFLFQTAGEIMSAPSLPPMVFAQQTYDVSSVDSSVQAGDILAIKEVKQSLKLLRGKTLACVDVQTGQKKKLFENCAGNFSTTPSDVKLYLPQLLQNCALPQQCTLCYTGANAKDVLTHIPSGIVEVAATKVEKSLVVTRVGSPMDTSSMNTHNLMELPLNLDIMVHAAWPKESEMRLLIDDTQRYYKTFSPASLNSVSLIPSNNPYGMSTQAVLLSAIRYDDCISLGIKISLPPKLASKPSNVQSDYEAESEDEYEIPDAAFAKYTAAKKNLQAEKKSSSGNSSPKSHYDTPKSSMVKPTELSEDSEEYDIPNAVPLLLGNTTTETAKTSQPLEQLQKQVDNLKCENKSFRITLEKLEKTCVGLNDSFAQLQKHVKALQQQEVQDNIRPNVSHQSVVTDTDFEANRLFLQSLSCEQVLHLLKEMHLEEHLQRFSREQISGAILSECDDLVLQELGVKSKLHRIRIINFITGKCSARQHIELRDPYVRCYKSNK